MNDERRGFESVVFDVTPRFIANGRIRLLSERANAPELTALEVRERRNVHPLQSICS